MVGGCSDGSTFYTIRKGENPELDGREWYNQQQYKTEKDAMIAAKKILCSEINTITKRM